MVCTCARHARTRAHDARAGLVSETDVTAHDADFLSASFG